MADPSRRRLLLQSSSLMVLLACKKDSSGDSGVQPDTDTGATEPQGTVPYCPSELQTATFVETLPFENEGAEAVGTVEGTGLDGRLAVDLGTLDEDALNTSIDDFFIRTRAPQSLDSSGWQVSFEGAFNTPGSYAATELDSMAEDAGAVLLECSGNGSNRGFGLISAANWRGVPLALLLDEADPTEDYILVEGLDDHPASSGSTLGASWIFGRTELDGAYLATQMNEEALTDDHGAPVRLLIPGWYGCCNIKWVQRVVAVAASEPSTSQMREFAGRTHQVGTPDLAADFQPATMDLAAMPVRVERWDHDGEVVYHVLGIFWGGQTADAQITLLAGTQEVPVEICVARAHPHTWGLWSAVWTPEATGSHDLLLRSEGSERTQRLDSGFYLCSVDIIEL